jgi:hypothetical protein
MQGQDTNDPFPGADAFPTYSAELLATAMTLSHGTNTHTFYDLGVNLDTGNPTPGLDFNPGDKATLDPFSEKSGSDLVALLEGTTLMLEALTIPPTTGDPFPTVFQLTAGQGYGVNFVYEKERTDGGETYLNVGALIFQQYDVTYDIENGRLGLTPIPEPSTALLVVSAAFVLRALQRRARLQPMGRITRRGDPLLTRHPRESHPAGSGALEEAEPASCL